MAALQSRGVGGFLKFSSKRPRLFVTSDDNEFDQETIEQWKDEGFVTTYLPYMGNVKLFKDQLMHLGDDLELGEHYAVIAYGQAASVCLSACIKPHHHMVALVAFYPTAVPAPKTTYPQQMDLLIHLAQSQGFGTSHPNYVYPETQPGFAEADLDEFDAVAAELAWTRTLRVLQQAFHLDVDHEPLWEAAGPEWSRKDTAVAMSLMSEEPCVNHVPTMTGGVGKQELARFYQNNFVKQNPPMKIKLVSRTQGIDRIVDELVISFRHSQRMDWILPDVPPTNKFVQVAMVCVVTIKGGKLDKESLYWDQASVLVQVGLLNPNLVPESMKSKGLRRLPVYGVEAAQKVMNEDSHPSNQLISSWRNSRTQPKMNGNRQRRPSSPD